jgi:hypothetical protein
MYEKDSRNVVKALSTANFRSPEKREIVAKVTQEVSGVKKIKVKKVRT